MSTLPLPRSRLALYLDLIRWDRPAGWLLLLWPTLSALWIAATVSAVPEPGTYALLLAGLAATAAVSRRRA